MKGKSYINLIVGVLVLAAFILCNLVGVKFQKQAILDVILNSGIMFVCWILIRNAAAEQGLIFGDREPNVRLTKKEHLLTSIEVSKHKAEFVAWCEGQDKKRLKQKRIAILSKTYLAYEDYFDDNGLAKNIQVPKPEQKENKKEERIENKKYKRACKYLNKARLAFVIPYVPDEIMQRDKADDDKHPFGISVHTWKVLNIAVSIAISLGLCLLLAFVSPSGKILNKQETIILIFEILIMVGSGFTFLFSAYSFKTGKWRDGLILKIRRMEEFYREKIGTISYEADVQNPDGSVTLGKKIFTEFKQRMEENQCMEVRMEEQQNGD